MLKIIAVDIIAVEYIDHASLSSSLAEMFHFLLTSVGAQDDSRCDDMIKGISKIDLEDDEQGVDGKRSQATMLNMTKMDYDTITEQGALSKDNKTLGAAEFDMVMQVHDIIKRKMQRSLRHHFLTLTITWHHSLPLSTCLCTCDSGTERQ